MPAGIRPSLAQARKDYPLPFGDGCHATESQTQSGTCEYGDRKGSRTMVLFGDSHALSWFPALVRIADEDGWRLVVLTKSACQSVDIAQYNKNLKRIYRECFTWRDEAFARIAQLRPDLVVVTNTRGFRVANENGTQLTGAAETAAWRSGMARTLTRLNEAAGHVVVIADVPLTRFDPPVCLSDHPESILACATPYDAAIDPGWIEQERAEASRGGASFIDPTLWVCPSTPCPPVLGNFLVLKDSGAHDDGLRRRPGRTAARGAGGRARPALIRERDHFAVIRTRLERPPSPTALTALTCRRRPSRGGPSCRATSVDEATVATRLDAPEPVARYTRYAGDAPDSPSAGWVHDSEMPCPWSRYPERTGADQAVAAGGGGGGDPSRIATASRSAGTSYRRHRPGHSVAARSRWPADVGECLLGAVDGIGVQRVAPWGRSAAIDLPGEESARAHPVRRAWRRRS